MEVRVFRRGIFDFLRDTLPMLAFTGIVAAAVMLGLWQAENSSKAEGRRLLEEGIKNAVVRHYAIEGSYPESLSLIEEKYGIFIDRAGYNVFYRVIAPNIMPDITVVELS
ncbi:MAG: hypothetical protein FWH02_08225 [Oscillospiraceae bacterium]|nr:hypothetical protein [Oscillospiraceae bacterium]